MGEIETCGNWIKPLAQLNHDNWINKSQICYLEIYHDFGVANIGAVMSNGERIQLEYNSADIEKWIDKISESERTETTYYKRSL